METTNWKPSTCQHFISFLVSALLYVTCFRYSNVDLGKSRGCLQRGSHIRIQGFTRFVRDGVEDKWRFFGRSLMFYTFLSATCVNTWRLVVHCLTSVSKHIQKNEPLEDVFLSPSMNDFQLYRWQRESFWVKPCIHRSYISMMCIQVPWVSMKRRDWFVQLCAFISCDPMILQFAWNLQGP